MNISAPFNDFTPADAVDFHGRIINDMRECGDEIARRVGDRSVVDYGCGPGVDAGRYTPGQYTGIDVSQPLLDEARRRNPSHQFDCNRGRPATWIHAGRVAHVMFKAVLEHQADADAVLWVLADAMRMASKSVLVAWHTPPRKTEAIREVVGASGRRIYQSTFALADFEHVRRTVTLIGAHELWEITP